MVEGIPRMACPSFMSKMRYISDGSSGQLYRLIMSSIGIWRCQHECDRRECHHCFVSNELDRLVEGGFKSYDSYKSTKRQYEPDRTNLPHADAKSNEQSTNRRRKSELVGDDSLYTIGSGCIQPLPGLLPPNEHHTFPYPESKSIATSTNNVLHRVHTSTDTHNDDIDYESKSCC